MHLNSILMFEKFARKHFRPKMRVLEVGPDKYPVSTYKGIVNDPSIIWHTLEIDPARESNPDNPSHIISKDGYSYPIPENSYDIVFSAQVFEHVADIEKWMIELKRITVPGGLIVTISPVSWPYHLAPIDCWRLYPEAFKVIAEHIGMEVVAINFESLELNHELVKRFPRSLIIPGESFNYRVSEKVIRKRISWNRIAGRIPFLKHLQVPIQVSYDVVSVFRKNEGA